MATEEKGRGRVNNFDQFCQRTLTVGFSDKWLVLKELSEILLASKRFSLKHSQLVKRSILQILDFGISRSRHGKSNCIQAAKKKEEKLVQELRILDALVRCFCLLLVRFCWEVQRAAESAF